MSNRLTFKDFAQFHLRELPAVRRRSSWDAIRAAWRRYRSRRRIARLDSHMLRDIGITFAEAEAEANKPFWRR
jgi:uncharacterized protein YjiS (DUF1127 family)